MHLFAVDSYMGRSINADSHFVALDPGHGDADVAIDDNRLADPSCEYEHVSTSLKG